MQGIDEIRRKNPKLAQKIQVVQGGFLLAEDVKPLIEVNRHIMVLVRCGMGRFLCPVDNVNHFMDIINKHAEMVKAHTGELLNHGTDYVRDVSLPA